jgi:hypothetical protein
MMKNLVLAAMMASILLWSCKKDNQPDYAPLILGTWINTHVDNRAVLTDGSFTFEFRSDNVQRFASGYTLDENNKSWISNEKYSYNVSGNSIIIDGVGALGSTFHLEFEIVSADENTLIYSVSKFLVDNVAYPDTKTYTNRKVKADLRNQFTGTWYGKSTTPGSADTSYHYWDYFEDGHFDYLYRDKEGRWIRKQDNEGSYFLYGDLLASNYTNDLILGVTGKAFECWNIRIEGNTMYWTGLRENGQVTSFRMERAVAPGRKKKSTASVK